MAEGEGHVLTLNCDCGHQFKEGLAGKNLETYEFKCPACGVGHKLTPEQIVAIVGAVDEAAEQLRAKMRGIAAKHPFIKYTEK